MMKRRAKVVVLKNGRRSGQWSMWNSADFTAQQLRPHYEVEIFVVPAFLEHVVPNLITKYVRYINVYLIAAVCLGFKSLFADLVICIDHSNAPALFFVPPPKRTAFVHDTIAIRQARGELSVAPSVRWSGRVLQWAIFNSLRQIHCLAVNTRIQTEELRALGIDAEFIEVGQPFRKHVSDFRYMGNAVNSRYLVCVGSDSWPKNKPYTIEVWAKLYDILGTECPNLILAGQTSLSTISLIEERVAPLIREVRSPSDSHLTEIISNSIGLLMLSLEEGFGVPPLEALALGKPIYISDIPIFRFIYEGAATFLSLDSAEDAAFSIARSLGSCACPVTGREEVLGLYSEEAVGKRTLQWIERAFCGVRRGGDYSLPILRK